MEVTEPIRQRYLGNHGETNMDAVEIMSGWTHCCRIYALTFQCIRMS